MSFTTMENSNMKNLRIKDKPTKDMKKKVKSREKIIALLSQDNTLSATALAKRIGISPPRPWKNRLPG